MAGPVALVAFSTKATPGWQHVLDYLMCSLGSGHADGYIHVTSTAAVDGSHEGESRPFLIDVNGELPRMTGQPGEDSARLDFYEAHFGLRPDAGIGVSAMCNGAEDHCILAAIVLALSQRLAGVIDMGLIVPRHVAPATDFDWPAIRLDVEAFTAELPGKAVAASYETSSGQVWALHTVDAEFLEGWRHHPDFHMAK